MPVRPSFNTRATISWEVHDRCTVSETPSYLHFFPLKKRAKQKEKKRKDKLDIFFGITHHVLSFLLPLFRLSYFYPKSKYCVSRSLHDNAILYIELGKSSVWYTISWGAIALMTRIFGLKGRRVAATARTVPSAGFGHGDSCWWGSERRTLIGFSTTWYCRCG